MRKARLGVTTQIPLQRRYGAAGTFCQNHEPVTFVLFEIAAVDAIQ